MIEEIETENEKPEANNKPRYYVDLSWHERKARSFRALIESRLCPACQARLGTEVEERAPAAKGKGEAAQEVRSVPFPANPVAQIRDCCSKSKDFIRPNMPLQEAMFRVILANGNQPLDAEEICQQLEWMGYGERARFINPTSSQKMLESDNYYGFVSVPASVKEPSEAA